MRITEFGRCATGEQSKFREIFLSTSWLARLDNVAGELRLETLGLAILGIDAVLGRKSTSDKSESDQSSRGFNCPRIYA
jgi:hypothetical protein